MEFQAQDRDEQRRTVDALCYTEEIRGKQSKKVFEECKANTAYLSFLLASNSRGTSAVVMLYLRKSYMCYLTNSRSIQRRIYALDITSEICKMKRRYLK